MSNGINYEQVASVANTALSKGEKPTVRSVRTELGTGSMATIQSHLKKWRDEQAALRQSSPLPESVISAILAEITYREGLAKSEFADQYSDAEVAIKELETGNKSLSEKVGSLEKELQEREKVIAVNNEVIGKLEKELADIKAQIEKEQKSAENARIKAAQAELKVESMNETVQVMKEFEKQNKKLLLELNGLQSSETERDKLLAVKQEMLEKLEKELVEVKSQVDVERKSAKDGGINSAKATQKLEDLTDTINAYKDENKELKAKLEESVRKRSSIEARLEVDHERTEDLKDENGELKVKLEALSNEKTKS